MIVFPKLDAVLLVLYPVHTLSCLLSLLLSFLPLVRSLYTGSSGTAYLILDVICAHISLCYFTLCVFNLQFKFYLSLAAYWNMDNSDEESQNSSENNFNEMVTVAIGAGFAFVHMLHVPPQGNHVIQVPELTGR